MSVDRIACGAGSNQYECGSELERYAGQTNKNVYEHGHVDYNMVMVANVSSV